MLVTETKAALKHEADSLAKLKGPTCGCHHLHATKADSDEDWSITVYNIDVCS